MEDSCRRKLIFFGSLSCYQSMYECHKLVEDCFSIMSGLQQPDHPESDEHVRQCEMDRDAQEEDLDWRVRNIVRMLTGKEIYFVK